MSETVLEKAQRLVDERRVIIEGMDRATVIGDTGRHTVIASPSQITCSCQGWRPTRACSHVYAAQAAWSEWIIEAAG